MDKTNSWWFPDKGEWIFIFGVILLFLNRYLFGDINLLEWLFSILLIMGGIVAYTDKNKKDKQQLKNYWVTTLVLIVAVLIYITFKFDLIKKATL